MSFDFDELIDQISRLESHLAPANEIVKATKIVGPLREIKIPDIDESVYVRKWTPEETDDFCRWIRKTGRGNMTAKIFVACALDANGARVFKRKQADMVGELPARLIYPVVEAFKELNPEHLDRSEVPSSNSCTGQSVAQENARPDDRQRFDEGRPAAAMRLRTEVWHLGYQGEHGEFPLRGNKAIAWLAKLLAAPNRLLTVAEVCGDPEGKLTADAILGCERETDPRGVRAIRERLEEIAEINRETGGSEGLENEQAELLCRLQAANNHKQITSPLKRAHSNIATQIRGLKKKLAGGMPCLAAHLDASIKLEFPHFGYYPPPDTPVWQI